MAMKYWRLKVKGEQSAEKIQSAVGRSGGILVRWHFEGGETHVYLAAKKSIVQQTAKSMKEWGTPEEVNADEVTKLG